MPLHVEGKHVVVAAESSAALCMGVESLFVLLLILVSELCVTNFGSFGFGLFLWIPGLLAPEGSCLW